MSSTAPPLTEGPPSMQTPSNRKTSLPVFLSLFGILCFTLTTVVLHFLQPDLAPLDEAVSYYVHGKGGWLLTVGLIAWGIGSLALAIGMNRRVTGPGSQVGLGCLGIWGFCVFLGGVFSADPRGNWNQPASISGMIHGNAAMIGFLVLPIAALQLSRAFHRHPDWQPLSGILSILAIATALSFLGFMTSLMPVFLRPGPPILLGLTERILLAMYAAWLSVATWGLVRTVKSGKPESMA